jgi:DNA-directed RNA polymerase subunit RPC12/RpoP
MTVYLCIRCKKTWRIDNGDIDDAPSGSLCKPCLKQSLAPLYRKRQSAERNFDCFAKATDYCDQHQCKYRELCLD